MSVRILTTCSIAVDLSESENFRGQGKYRPEFPSGTKHYGNTNMNPTWENGTEKGKRKHLHVMNEVGL